MFEFYNNCCCNLNLNPDPSIACSVARNPDVPISQKPRFYGVNAGRNVSIYCLCSKELQPAKAEWYRADEYKAVFHNTSRITAGNKYELIDYHGDTNVFLVIRDVRLKDSGVYFCKINNKWGPGTAVQVARSGVDQARRSNMKDALIILQALLLAVCIAAVLLRKRQQGLAIETCSGSLYEELSVYAQAEGTEAPWE
ncbi:Ig kappa chain V region S211 [Dissostichus eleginoides]|uniref:Ig kappa chain V region S211 n=1 Tax=Dissostichus eleginoides TaxID=100907 RepID=A0AAD9BF56_DISEL|nr:Ig kappa chain V region S211 [Dissostichus eleginoides]